jgi:hypothetical protein
MRHIAKNSGEREKDATNRRQHFRQLSDERYGSSMTPMIRDARPLCLIRRRDAMLTPRQRG